MHLEFHAGMLVMDNDEYDGEDYMCQYKDWGHSQKNGIMWEFFPLGRPPLSSSPHLACQKLLGYTHSFMMLIYFTRGHDEDDGGTSMVPIQ